MVANFFLIALRNLFKKEDILLYQRLRAGARYRIQPADPGIRPL
jgi:hypothetical protein